MDKLVTRDEMQNFVDCASVVIEQAEKSKRRCAVFPLFVVKGLVRVCLDRETPKRFVLGFGNPINCTNAKMLCPRCSVELRPRKGKTYCFACGQLVDWYGVEEWINR